MSPVTLSSVGCAIIKGKRKGEKVGRTCTLGGPIELSPITYFPTNCQFLSHQIKPSYANDEEIGSILIAILHKAHACSRTNLYIILEARSRAIYITN